MHTFLFVVNEFKRIKWLPTKERFEQCVCVSSYKFCNNKAPAYTSDIYKRVDYSNATRSGKHKLKQPFKSLNVGQRGLSYLGPKLWNNISSNIKSAESTNAFKHQIKDHFFKVIQEKEDNIYIYY